MEISGKVALVSDADAVRAAVPQTVEQFGSLHPNINTAGFIADAPVVRNGAATPLAEFDRLVTTNLMR
ncbi:hypothetical protein [Kribbella endophytica]